MRAFIAMPIPEEIKNIIIYLQNELKTAGADIKWVRPENIHLTLKFLGEIKEEKIPLIKKIMDKIAEEVHVFTASVSSLGAFPKKELPKVIWLGIEKGDQQIREIAKKLQEELQRVGIPKETRPFSSHITLGRMRSPNNLKKLIDKLNLISKYSPKEKKDFFFDKIILYKSTLTPQGPLYEEIYTRNLKTS